MKNDRARDRGTLWITILRWSRAFWSVATAAQATAPTNLARPSNVASAVPVAGSHRRTFSSQLAVARRRPSGDQATPRTSLVWPTTETLPPQGREVLGGVAGFSCFPRAGGGQP